MQTTRDPAVTAATRKHLVLIIEDDVDTRGALTELLDRAGYAAAEARDGAEALRLLRSGLKPFAMFIDLNMPEMDGEAFSHACANEPELSSIWRIIVSGHAENVAVRCNAHAFVPKPVDDGAVFALLDHLGTGRVSRRTQAMPVTA